MSTWIDTGGSGNCFAQRRVSKHRNEIEKANRMGKEMFADEDTRLLIDPKSSHFLRTTKKRKKNIQRSSSTTKVRSQTNVTHAVSVATVSSEIPSS